MRSVAVGCAYLAAVLVLYFAVPVGADISRSRLVIDILVAGLAILAIGTIVVREAWSRDRRRARGVLGLLLLFETVTVLFALTYFIVATNTAHQFEGLETRIDALYFTLTTTTTVGYGDIHASGQVARALLIGNLVFNVGFLAVVGGLIGTRLRGRDDA